MTCPCQAEISPCGQQAFGVSDTRSVGLRPSLNDQAVVSERSFFSAAHLAHNTWPPFFIQLAARVNSALFVFRFLPRTSFLLSCLISSYPLDSETAACVSTEALIARVNKSRGGLVGRFRG